MDERDRRVQAGTGISHAATKGGVKKHVDRADESGDGWATGRERGLAHGGGGDERDRRV